MTIDSSQLAHPTPTAEPAGEDAQVLTQPMPAAIDAARRALTAVLEAGRAVEDAVDRDRRRRLPRRHPDPARRRPRRRDRRRPRPEAPHVQPARRAQPGPRRRRPRNPPPGHPWTPARLRPGPDPAPGAAGAARADPADLPAAQEQLNALLQHGGLLRPERFPALAAMHARACLLLAESLTRTAPFHDDDDHPRLDVAAVRAALRRHARSLQEAALRAGSIAGIGPGDARPVRQAGEIDRCLQQSPDAVSVDRPLLTSVVHGIAGTTRALASASHRALQSGDWLIPDHGDSLTSPLWRRRRPGDPTPSPVAAIRRAAANSVELTQALTHRHRAGPTRRGGRPPPGRPRRSPASPKAAGPTSWSSLQPGRGCPGTHRSPKSHAASADHPRPCRGRHVMDDHTEPTTDALARAAQALAVTVSIGEALARLHAQRTHDRADAADRAAAAARTEQALRHEQARLVWAPALDDRHLVRMAATELLHARDRARGCQHVDPTPG